MFEAEQATIETKIRAFCAANNLPEVTFQWKWIPFSGHWGISTSFFQLAAMEARLGKNINVNQRAKDLAAAIAEYLGTIAAFEKIEAVNGYLNLYFSQALYAQRVVDTVLTEGKAFGRGPARGERVMVEFSQPNTHKAFHVGHLRSAILGDTLARILEFSGYDVVRANYPGDIGLHVIKWLWCYMNFHQGEKPEKDITRWMGQIYSEAYDRLEQNPQLEDEVRALYARWDQRDPDIVHLWEETRQWSLDGFNDIYEMLDIRFDRYYFNSQAEQPGKEVVRNLIERGIARDERPDGPVIVKIDEVLGSKNEKYRTLVILRADGTALYATEDLALAIQKFKDYPDLVKSYYVVDVRQSLHFQQVFKILEIAGYPWANRCQHVPYELVNLPGNVVMAARAGTVVLLEDLIRESTARAFEIVQKKNPNLSNEQKQAVANAVGIGTIKYPILARENTKVVTFDWESALSETGQASTYIQFEYVRTGGILRNLGTEIPQSTAPDYDLSTQEIELIDMIARLPGEVSRAVAELSPLTIANYSYELAKAFSRFFFNCQVLKSEEPVRSFRLRLVAATRQALASSLALLGITAPQVM